MVTVHNNKDDYLPWCASVIRYVPVGDDDNATVTGPHAWLSQLYLAGPCGMHSRSLGKR